MDLRLLQQRPPSPHYYTDIRTVHNVVAVIEAHNNYLYISLLLDNGISARDLTARFQDNALLLKHIHSNTMKTIPLDQTVLKGQIANFNAASISLQQSLLVIEIPLFHQQKEEKKNQITEDWEIIGYHYAENCYGKEIEFLELATPKDHDCAFHCLGITRQQGSQQLIQHKHDRTIRQLVAPEIYEAFVGLQLPEAMSERPEWQKYYKRFNELSDAIDKFARLLRSSLCSQGFDRNRRNTMSFEELADLADCEESRLLKKTLNKWRDLNVELRSFCSSVEVFDDFIMNYVSQKGNWMGYLRGCRTSTLDALAFINHLKVRIWTMDSEVERLKVVHEFNPESIASVTSYSSEELTRCLKKVEMFHTDNMSHFNLLKELDKDEL